MADKTKSRTLKVYRTRIGLHDWLVAAPSQKAALQAWDVKKNLFSMGAASVVTDRASIELAMQTPRKPVPVDADKSVAKLSRVISLNEHRRRKARRPLKRQPALMPAKLRKHDRSQLDRAERALEEFQRQAVRERTALLRSRRALDLRAENLEADLKIELQRLEKALQHARKKYEAAED